MARLPNRKRFQKTSKRKDEKNKKQQKENRKKEKQKKKKNRKNRKQKKKKTRKEEEKRQVNLGPEQSTPTYRHNAKIHNNERNIKHLTTRSHNTDTTKTQQGQERNNHAVHPQAKTTHADRTHTKIQTF